MHKNMHAMYKIGPQGEPLEPQSVISTFSNQCSYIVKEHMPITYLNWRKVSEYLKGAVCGDVKSRFKYLVDQYDELCKGHTLYIAGKALQSCSQNSIRTT
jgi:hypothetical protein